MNYPQKRLAQGVSAQMSENAHLLYENKWNFLTLIPFYDNLPVMRHNIKLHLITSLITYGVISDFAVKSYYC